MQNKIGNDYGDYLARIGISGHLIDREFVSRTLRTMKLTQAVQTMMVQILEARAAAIPEAYTVVDSDSEAEDSIEMCSDASSDHGAPGAVTITPDVCEVESTASEDE
eukprot:4394601-Karenia_brevis.AAC.1